VYCVNISRMKSRPMTYTCTLGCCKQNLIQMLALTVLGVEDMVDVKQ